MLGLKIYAAESTKFTQKMTYEDVLEGIRAGKYKMTYTEKRTESEIISLIENKKIRINEEAFNIVPDDVFRKIRHGKGQTPPSKQ